MEEEKFGAVIFDGKIYNLDKMPLEEITKLKQRMMQEEKNLTEQIDNEIDLEDDKSDEDEDDHN